MVTPPSIRQARHRGAVLAALLLLSVGCARHGAWDRALADPGSEEFTALVDSDPARLLLADLLTRESAEWRLTRASTALDADGVPGASALALDPARRPDQARLRDLAEGVSLDFAALVFARAIGAGERSRAVQAAFDRFVRDGAARSEEILREPGGFPYTVLLVPSWLYRSHPENEGDFSRQRRLLDRLGIPNRLIRTSESGSVEDNAAAVAAAVREAGRRGNLLVISASKSGAEVALALSRLLTPDQAASVAGWLNVAGALHGTPLADAALRPPVSWIARLVFWLSGWDWEGLTSMATGPSRTRLENALLPGPIAVVNLVAVPVSGSVGRKVFVSYRLLRGHGPNDGVVLLADTVWPGGASIVALGSDHLFSAGQDDARATALLRALDFAVRLHRAAPAE